MRRSLVRAVVDALEDPPASPHDFLGIAHRALPPPVEPVEPTEEVIGWMRDLGWESCVDSPLLGSLARAVADARAAGVPLSASSIADYAEAVRQSLRRGRGGLRTLAGRRQALSAMGP